MSVVTNEIMEKEITKRSSTANRSRYAKKRYSTTFGVEKQNHHHTMDIKAFRASGQQDDCMLWDNR